MQVRRGRIAAEFDAERTVLLQLLLQFFTGDEFLDALFEKLQLFVG